MKLVARQLGISPRTVAFHKYRAMNLLGLHGNKELMEFAIRTGLLGEAHEPNPDKPWGRHEDEQTPRGDEFAAC